jgi:two-component system LytT family response regulator
MAEGCQHGIQAIEKHDPQLLFLDVQMPDGSGFKLLEHFNNPAFEVIFTTAYDQYAIQAIKFSALDYLLKPISPDDLVEAINRFNNQTGKGEKIKTLLNNIKSSSDKQCIVVNSSDGMHILKVNDIVRCQADDYYTLYYLVNNKVLMISKTLKETEELLKDFDFMRVHKSHLVNKDYIKSYLRESGGTIEMVDGSKLPVSRRKKDVVMEYIENL